MSGEGSENSLGNKACPKIRVMERNRTCPGRLERGRLQVLMRLSVGQQVSSGLWVMRDLVSFPKENTLSSKTHEGFQADKGCTQVYKFETCSKFY